MNTSSNSGNPKSSFQVAKKGLTLRNTYLLVANVIGRNSFPRKNSWPWLFPALFQSYGHEFLFDRKLYFHVILNTGAEIEELANTYSLNGPGWKMILYYILVITLTILIITFSKIPFLLVLISSAIALVLGYLRYTNKRLEEFNKEVCRLKKQRLEELINGEYHNEVFEDLKAATLYKNAFTSQSYQQEEVKFPVDFLKHNCFKILKNKMDLIGDANIEGTEGFFPIIVVDDSDNPFPGFGRRQFEQLYVCKPVESSHKITETHLNVLQKKIREKLDEATFFTTELPIGIGKILAISSETIGSDSPILSTTHKVPKLWIDEEKFNHLKELGQDVSMREFDVIQIIFPEYYSSASFFIRSFFAGNSASVEIVVYTKGPTYITKDRILEKIEQYANQLSGEPLEGPSISNLSYRKISFRDEYDSQKERNSISKDVLLKKKKNKSVWPGRYSNSSLFNIDYEMTTFTNDLFGKKEGQATIATLIDQISTKILSGLEELGFDTSGYKDSSGNYTINAEKIESLVMGERIQMTKEDKSSEKKTEKLSDES